MVYVIHTNRCRMVVHRLQIKILHMKVWVCIDCADTATGPRFDLSLSNERWRWMEQNPNHQLIYVVYPIMEKYEQMCRKTIGKYGGFTLW